MAFEIAHCIGSRARARSRLSVLIRMTTLTFPVLVTESHCARGRHKIFLTITSWGCPGVKWGVKQVQIGGLLSTRWARNTYCNYGRVTASPAHCST